MIVTTSPKPFVFVLMPFDKGFDDIYKLGIKAACQEAGAYCERVDEQIFTESILERVYNQIAKADLIVSDLSGRNPNVFYETGFAHALGKQVVHLTKNGDDIPFDLKHFPHVIYEGSISLLKEELKRRVVWHIENPRIALSNADLSIEIYINGIRLKDDPTIQIDSKISRIVEFTIQFHNPSNKVYNLEEWQFGLITPHNFVQLVNENLGRRSYNFYENQFMKVLLEEEVLFLFPTLEPQYLLPESWLSYKFIVHIEPAFHPDLLALEIPNPEEEDTEKTSIPIESNFSIRVFNILGPKDFPFRAKINFIRWVKRIPSSKAVTPRLVVSRVELNQKPISRTLQKKTNANKKKK